MSDVRLGHERALGSPRLACALRSTTSARYSHLVLKRFPSSREESIALLGLESSAVAAIVARSSGCRALGWPPWGGVRPIAARTMRPRGKTVQGLSREPMPASAMEACLCADRGVGRSAHVARDRLATTLRRIGEGLRVSASPRRGPLIPATPKFSGVVNVASPLWAAAWCGCSRALSAGATPSGRSRRRFEVGRGVQRLARLVGARHSLSTPLPRALTRSLERAVPELHRAFDPHHRTPGRPAR